MKRSEKKSLKNIDDMELYIFSYYTRTQNRFPKQSGDCHLINSHHVWLNKVLYGKIKN